MDLCQEADLVWGRELYVDATKVGANADIDSLVPRFYHEAKCHVAALVTLDLASTNGREENGAHSLPSGGLVDLPAWEEHPEAPRRPGETPRWNLLEQRRLDPHWPSISTYQRVTALRVSATDPDVSPMGTERGTRLGYHDHDVVDGGKQRLTLATLVTPADVMENVPLRDLLWRVCFRRKVRLRQITGGTTYGTVENIVALENAGIRAYVSLPDFSHRTPFFGQSAFVYDAEADAYRCPGDQVLGFRKHKHTARVRVYQVPAGICNACSLKTQRTDSARGRQVKRSFDEAYLNRVRSYYANEPY